MKLHLRLVAIVCGFIVCGFMLVAAPSMAVEITSDTLRFDWNGVSNSVSFGGPGEAVGEEIDYSFTTPTSGFGSHGSLNTPVTFYLVEPGTVTSTSGLLSTGFRSDTITLKLSFEGNQSTVTVTMGSDEDPGTSDVVTGLLETGIPQNITQYLFAGLDVSGFDHPPAVWVTSDVEATAVPEPATLLLLGSGLVGLVGYRRMKRMM